MRHTSDAASDLEGGESCLVGTLEVWPLADLLEWMNATERSGMIRIGHGLGAGVIFFARGLLYRCEWGPANGEEALIRLYALRAGCFSLIPRCSIHPRSNITRPTPELLLECAVALQQGARGVQA